MTDPVAIALIGAITTTLVGVFNGFVAIKTHAQSKINGKTLDAVAQQTNGLQDKLMAAAHTEGMAAQRAEDAAADSALTKPPGPTKPST
jgi:FlaG/FlaF family flagellin (archaellin)